MPPYRRYSVTMEILSFPFLFARKFSSMRTHFAAVSTNGVSKLRTQSRPCITFSLALPLRNGKIVPVVQLAAHAKSSTLYGRTVVQPNFLGLMGYYYFVYSYFNLRCRIKASSLQDKTEGEYGILMNNFSLDCRK